jgi:hypothetical protein
MGFFFVLFFIKREYMATRLEQALQGYNANVGAQIDSGRMFQENLKDRLKDLASEQQQSDENETNMIGMHFFGDKIKSWLSNKLGETLAEKVGGEAGQTLKNLIKNPAETVSDALKSAGEKVMSKVSDVAEDLSTQAQNMAGSLVERATGALGEGLSRVTEAGQELVGRGLEAGQELVGRGVEAGQALANRATDLANQATRTAQDVADQATRTAQDVADQATQAMRTATDTAQNVADQAMRTATDTAQNVADQATRTVQSATDTAQSLAEQATRTAQSLAQQAPRIFGEDDVARAIDNLNISDAGKDLVTRSLDDNDAFRQLYRQRFPDRPELTDEEAEEARGATRDSLQSRGERLRQQEPAEEPTAEPPATPAQQATSSTPELNSGTPEAGEQLARGVARNVENLESETRPTPRLFEGAPKIVKETTAPPEEPDAPTSTTAPPVEPPVEPPVSELPEGADMSLSELGDLEIF